VNELLPRLADNQLLGDLPIAQPLGNERGNLTLARAQLPRGIAFTVHVTARLVECAFIGIGLLSLLTIVTLPAAAARPAA